MPTLLINNFNVVCATLGGFITIFGLVSYLLKETFYLSEALISFCAGVTFSPHAANFIKPVEFAGGIEENVDYVTLYFSRLVLGVQLVIAGVQLPSRYLKTEWRSLFILIGPGMCAMWICSALLIWALVPHLQFLHALAIAACITPTDPVLSNSIVKGKFADKNIPKELQKIIIAESGANDGLGYPFLFIALYLIKYTQGHGLGPSGGASTAIGLWFGETWGYTIILSLIYGAAVGWLAKGLLHYAEEHKFVDRESFLVFAITLALFIVGTCGMIGSDDVLACFVAGNTFTWDDWFRLETMDDSIQPTIDMLLNVSIFMWYGAVAPWVSYRINDVIPIYRLIPLGILILLFRRIPFIMAVHKHIHQIDHWQQALFVGFFGPIGVSAVFYLYVSIDFLQQITFINDAGTPEVREDARHLEEAMRVIIWFIVTCSIVVHGLTIPLGKVGYHLPRTVSSALSVSQDRGGDGNLDDRQSNDRIPFRLRFGSTLSFDYRGRSRGTSRAVSRNRNTATTAPSFDSNNENSNSRGRQDPEPYRPVFRDDGTRLRTGIGVQTAQDGSNVSSVPASGAPSRAATIAEHSPERPQTITEDFAASAPAATGGSIRPRMIKFARSETGSASQSAPEARAGNIT